ncbi:hypothetical protein KY348_05740 [Candidatus Woesearchaeota archaeon]|nr:hypothetical protein [Candidatus Woesearchaeota archaeon]
MKRPGVVWVFSVLMLIGIYFNLWNGISQLFVLGTLNAVSTIIGILTLIIVVPWIILLVNFFTLKKKAKLWAHISFGTVTGLIIISYIIFFATTGPLGTALVAPPSIIVLAVYIFVWWAVVDYIKKKKLEGKPLFN